jgi:cytochrome c
MDSFELNKILGAILGTLLFIMGVGFLAEAIYAPIEGRGPGYALPEPQAAETATAAPAEQVTPLPVRLASASADRGQTAARKCQSCHNFAEGAGAKVGPELYGVVGRVMGSWDSFAYSDAMEAHKANGDTWTFDRLDAFITAPRTDIPGTKMTFAGDKDPQERADILAYLQTLSHDPVPFPAPEAAPADAAAAPAAGGTAPAAQPGAAPQVDNGTGAATVTQGEQPVEGTPTTSAPGTAQPAEPAPAQ